MRTVGSWLTAICILTPITQAWSAQTRDLTFDQRVAAQTAIERIYYSHQSGTRQPFEEAVPRAVLERKVRTYLEQSAAIDALWHTPVTATALRHEWDRIEASTRFPERLREVYGALGHDPFLIQECLIRPVLVDRLTRSFFASDPTIHRPARQRAEAVRDALLRGASPGAIDGVGAARIDAVRDDASASGIGPYLAGGLDGRTSYRRATPGSSERARGVTIPLSEEELAALRASLPDRVGEIGPVLETPESFRVRVLVAEDRNRVTFEEYSVSKITWDDWWGRTAGTFDVFAVSTVAAVEPEGSSRARAWTGELADSSRARVMTDSRVSSASVSRFGRDIRSRHGSAVSPSSLGTCGPGDSWSAGILGDAPYARYNHLSVWTGSLMLVWGGTVGGTTVYNNGSRYDPVTDAWSPMSQVGAPEARLEATAVWTGEHMIVWGGHGTGGGGLPTGGRYDPVADAWTATSVIDAPGGTRLQTAVWTGSEMIVWGGVDNGNTGGRYDSDTDTWTPTSTVNAPAGRYNHTAVWTGSVMVVWGGFITGTGVTNTGGRYDPVHDTWTATTLGNAPTARERHAAVWASVRMLVWGGGINGGSYDPVNDAWVGLQTVGAPSSSTSSTKIWTGAEMIVWPAGTGTNAGARYDPFNNTWTATTVAGAPTGRGGHTAVWTGDRMIVWGGSATGEGVVNTGGRYDPVTDSWTPTGPFVSARKLHTAIWTGNLMIVWGGTTSNGNPTTNTGARYDPVLDSMTPTSTVSAPTLSLGHTAVWTGSKMIVWGQVGSNSSAGGLYDPISDSWQPVSTSGAPIPRTSHVAVWTGSLMIVHGGWVLGPGGSVSTNTGGRYDPDNDSWTPTSPSGSYVTTQHAAVWTGSRMIAWGGRNGGDLATGAVYDPVGDSWTPTTTTGAPGSRFGHVMVWTGSRMVVMNGIHSPPTGYYAEGGRYDPVTDAWQPTTFTNAPTARWSAAGAWVGNRLMIWGGYGDTGITDTGGLYDPVSDTWTPTSMAGAPPARMLHTAVSTGDSVIVWGGGNGYGDGTYTRNDGSTYLVDVDSDGVAGCDNCPLVANPDQIDTDGDGSGDACDADDDGDGLADGSDNCPLLANPGQDNADGDALGDACDACPFDAANDADGDTVCGNVDNCPSVANPSQTNADADALGDACDSCPGDAQNDQDNDGICAGSGYSPPKAGQNDNCPAVANPLQANADADAMGDACDVCPSDAANDPDQDGICAGSGYSPPKIGQNDNCPTVSNPLQADSDGDGFGNPCDNCANDPNGTQTDTDGDGGGDACDCQPFDPSDLRPSEVAGLTAARTPAGGTLLSWIAAGGADVYSISRGVVSARGPGQYGACLAEGVTGTSYEDPAVPSPGQGFFYLVQAQNYDCGMSTLGFASSEQERVNQNPGACAGQSHADAHAGSESTTFGTVTGTFASTVSSNDVVEAITEVLSTGGSPSSRFSRLEHRWTIALAAGSRKELHVEGFASSSSDGDDFRFEISTNGVSFTPIAMSSLPSADDNVDRVGVLPGGLSGTVTIRVVDSDRTAGHQSLDTVSIDEIFVRSLP